MIARLRVKGGLMYVIAFLAVYGAVIAAGLTLNPIRPDFPDAKYYAAMASGEWTVGTPPQPVPQPFSERILVPVLAGWIAAPLDLEPRTAIGLVNTLALIGIGVTIAIYFVHRAVPLPIGLAVAATPLFSALARYPTTVDLTFFFFALLTLLMLFENRRLATIASAFFALLSRTTLIVYYPFLIICLFVRRQWLQILGLAIVTISAVLLIQIVKPVDTGNVHGLSGPVYLVLKVAINTLKNVAGIDFWTNTVAWCENPVVTFDVGTIPGLGDIRSVGVCAVDVARIGNTFLHYAFLLGAVHVMIFRNGGRTALPRRSDRRNVDRIDYLVCFWAFALLFLTAPGYGHADDGAMARFFVYAAPWAIVLLPRLPALPRGWWPVALAVGSGVPYTLLT